MNSDLREAIKLLKEAKKHFKIDPENGAIYCLHCQADEDSRGRIRHWDKCVVYRINSFIKKVGGQP
jgi:hypothetical protein